MLVQELRSEIVLALLPGIAIRRASLASIGREAGDTSNLIRDDEVDEFLLSNPLYDVSVAQLLLPPPGVNAAALPVPTDQKWLEEFRRATLEWADTNSWLGADEPWAAVGLPTSTPTETRELWTPGDVLLPSAFSAAPTTLAVASRLLREGRDLTELLWRQLEELVADLLSADGWTVRLTPESGDGGVDVFAVRNDPAVGPILTVWQAKRYSPHRKVGIGTIRELIAVREEQQASKAFIATTSTLTQGALTRITQEHYRIGAMQGPDLASWVERVVDIPSNKALQTDRPSAGG
jgi:hypothetical protein